jgi:hypothetical protein
MCPEDSLSRASVRELSPLWLGQVLVLGAASEFQLLIEDICFDNGTAREYIRKRDVHFWRKFGFLWSLFFFERTSNTHLTVNSRLGKKVASMD